MKGLKLFTVVMVLLTITTGCWNIREVQDINYATAIGVDYSDGKCIMYVQMLDFSSVAKLEGQQKLSEAPVWVGKGTGKSFTEAANSLYSTSQKKLLWGHVSAIVFSERILKQNKYRDVLELLDRYREIRYLVWAFSTRESIEDIFNNTPFFKESPKMSILHSPEDHYRQSSIIKPVRLYQFITSLKEDARISYLASLRIVEDQWKESRKAHPLLEYEGMHVFQKDRYRGLMDLNDLQGLPWMNEKTVRAPLYLFRGNSLAAVLVMEKPEVQITPSVQPGGYFDVTVILQAGVNEMHQEMTKRELISLAEQKTEEQIRHTYRQGFERKVDVYNLSEPLFRRNPSEWHRLADEDQFLLREDSLRSVRVIVELTNTGRYKFNPGM
ncbi:Ger(x)C family spore germination protein [Paenibacillus naphthalenovorans]|uniref:Germination protein GerC n=1 Tax=Paenibacillus naphthalenovorans TaxID=162209 RepID=A0A0U2IMK2_9BACL|nr:Ger(x)C family spore germination protein [Paenibacillus naphthalenovorans]ALS22843.1 germination protein GerC [Paenibacillus naphthalenovorans]